MKKNIKVFFLISIIINFLFISYVLFPPFPKKSIPKDRLSDYPLLSPRIFAENQNDILINFLPLRNKLKEITANYGDTFSLYFEYLPTGTSIGINEKAELSAASLIKLPVVMAYFHQKEHTSLQFTETKVKIQEKEIDKGFGTLWQKGAGAEITLEEAVRLALVESDNTAALVLADHIAEESLKEVYEGLDIDLIFKNNRVIISAKQYASILKALYFSAVLSKESSQEILDILTKTKFSDKLPAGIDKDIPVAHKIGILELEDSKLYQDCGIVYIPKRSYLLCIFSQSDKNTARERMKAISSEVFTYLKGVNGKK